MKMKFTKYLFVILHVI